MIQGKIHRYLGMTLDYTANGISRICMMEYIDEILTAFKKMDQSISVTKYSVAPQNLFKVYEDCEQISPDKS